MIKKTDSQGLKNFLLPNVKNNSVIHKSHLHPKVLATRAKAAQIAKEVKNNLQSKCMIYTFTVMLFGTVTIFALT